LITGSELWKRSNCAGYQFIEQSGMLYGYAEGKKLMVVDSRDGRMVQEHSTVEWSQGKLQLVAATGGLFLFANEATKTLRWIDPKTREVVLEREFPADVVFSIEESSGVFALDNSGLYHYWRLSDRKEVSNRVVLQDDKFEINGNTNSEKQISVHRFGDTLLVLPYWSAFEYKSPEINPRAVDGYFAPVSGSMFAVSRTSGDPIWDKSLAVKHFYFPLQQIRFQTPTAILVRRVLLPRANAGKIAEMVGVGLVDLRTGRVVFEQHDFLGTRAMDFSQRILQSIYRQEINFFGVTLEATWMNEPAADGQATTQPAAGSSGEGLGFMDMRSFRAEMERRFQEKRSQLGVPSPSPIELQDPSDMVEDGSP
jgi:hypothetical protein